jgi:hypothetical protein
VARKRWTDDRLSDLATIVQPLPGEVARSSEAIGRFRSELSAVGSGLRAEVSGMRGDLSAFQRQITHMGWTLSAALLGVLIALIVAVV